MATDAAHPAISVSRAPSRGDGGQGRDLVGLQSQPG